MQIREWSQIAFKCQTINLKVFLIFNDIKDSESFENDRLINIDETKHIIDGMMLTDAG